MILGGFVFAVSVALLGQARTLDVAMLAMAAGAGGALLIEVVATTLFQRIVPDAVRGRMIGVMETLAVTAYAAGSFLLPVLAVSLGTEPVLAAAGVLLAASVLGAIPLIGGYDVQRPPDEGLRERLLRVPVFAGLAPARLEAAMSRARIVPMAAGQAIVRQGDPADRFYVIAEGTVEVRQSEAGNADRFLRRMGPDEVFGEIGLLSSGRRTATVTAVEAGTLLALDGPAFLELVSSGPGLTSRLLDLHRGATPVATTGS